MMVKALNISTQNADYSSLSEDTPQWLRPYMAAALRSGLISGLDMQSMDANAAISGAQAAVMLQNALDLSVSDDVLKQVSAMDDNIPEWAAPALTVLYHNGIALSADTPLTRAEAAKVLYRADYLSLTAPGLEVIRKQG